MKNNPVHAEFVPSTDIHPNALLRETPPQVIAALHSIYPFLVAANRVLSFLTWTTKSYYRNFVLISIFVLSVLHWNNYIIIALPTLTVLTYCCTSWFVKTSFVDTVSDRIPPTLEEIVDTLDNFNMRSNFVFGPECPSSRLKRLFLSLCLLTPFYIYLMKNYISCRAWIVSISLFAFMYYSTWFIALRRLLFRLKTTKKLLKLLTGEDYSVIDNEMEVTLLNLNTKNTLDKNTKVIEFHLLENERRWFGLGWCKKLMFFERSPYCTLDLKQSLCKLDDFQFPKLKNYENTKWIWLDKTWVADQKGWTYYDNSWAHPQDTDSVTRYTRSRKLRRQCLVVVNK